MFGFDPGLNGSLTGSQMSYIEWQADSDENSISGVQDGYSTSGGQTYTASNPETEDGSNSESWWRIGSNSESWWTINLVWFQTNSSLI